MNNKKNTNSDMDSFNEPCLDSSPYIMHKQQPFLKCIRATNSALLLCLNMSFLSPEGSH